MFQIPKPLGIKTSVYQYNNIRQKCEIYIIIYLYITLSFTNINGNYYLILHFK